MFAWIWNRSFKDLADFDVRRIEFYLHSFFPHPGLSTYVRLFVCVEVGAGAFMRLPLPAVAWQGDAAADSSGAGECRRQSSGMTNPSGARLWLNRARIPDALTSCTILKMRVSRAENIFNRFKDLCSLPRTESLFPVIEEIVNNGWVDSHSFIRKLRPLSHLPSHPFSSCINP